MAQRKEYDHKNQQRGSVPSESPFARIKCLQQNVPARVRFVRWQLLRSPLRHQYQPWYDTSKTLYQTVNREHDERPVANIVAKNEPVSSIGRQTVQHPRHHPFLSFRERLLLKNVKGVRLIVRCVHDAKMVQCFENRPHTFKAVIY
jgi:hypothetical protein